MMTTTKKKGKKAATPKPLSQEVRHYLHEVGTKGGEQRSARKAAAVRENAAKGRAAIQRYRQDPSSRPQKQ
jgi:hypothetical protein